MAVDITTLILQDILKISTSLIRDYSSVGDQLIYLILIPSVIVLLFVYVFGGWIAGSSPKFHYLITIVSYIFIIYSGWYGSFIVPIVINWFAITLGLAFVFFIITKVIHPIRGKAIYELSGAAGKRLKEATMGKTKARKEVEKQMSELRRQISIMNARIAEAEASNNRYLANTYRMRKTEYEQLLAQKQSQLDEM